MVGRRRGVQRSPESSEIEYPTRTLVDVCSPLGSGPGREPGEGTDSDSTEEDPRSLPEGCPRSTGTPVWVGELRT